MSRSEKFEISLSSELAEFVRERVANGGYASADEVIAQALHAMTFDEHMNSLIPAEVLKKAIDEAGPDQRTHTTEEVHEYLLEHHRRHVADIAKRKIAG